jgi:malonyl-CoA/methylmalonyl-CoA synthetase
MVGAHGTFFAGASVEQLKDFCRKSLAGYKKPRRVAFADALPRNALGKVLKHRVREGLIKGKE